MIYNNSTDSFLSSIRSSGKQKLNRQQSIWSSSSDGGGEVPEDNTNEFHTQFKLKDKWYNNIYIVAPCSYGSALLVGTMFYSLNDGIIGLSSFFFRTLLFLLLLFFKRIFLILYTGWPISTSFYFAAQTLLGVGFGVPYENNDFSHVFSSVYIIFGTTMIVGSSILNY